MLNGKTRDVELGRVKDPVGDDVIGEEAYHEGNLCVVTKH